MAWGKSKTCNRSPLKECSVAVVAYERCASSNHVNQHYSISRILDYVNDHMVRD